MVMKLVQDLKVKLLNDLVLIRPDHHKGLSDGGLLLPHGAQIPPSEGIVVVVGPGRTENGVLVPMTVKVGDRAAFGPGEGVEVTLAGQTLRLMFERVVCWVYL